MGLDMYLYRVRKMKNHTFADVIEIAKNYDEDDEEQTEKMKEYLQQNSYGDYKWISFFKEVAYWRKVNCVHNWFVENVQNGRDECGYYSVSKEKIEELLDIVKTVYESLNGKALIEKTSKNGHKVKVFKDIDTEKARELLPTTEGFFFGDTKYNEYYFENLKDTIAILTEILIDFNFENNYLVYHSSW